MAVLFVFMDIVFRFLPVLDYSYPQPVNNNSPVPKLLPNRVMTFSKGWNFRYKNTVKVNNDGFINDHGYSPIDEQPLVAVVGDSYIEALMVPYEATLQGRLAHEFRARLRVYSFGLSGAARSGYLIPLVTVMSQKRRTTNKMMTARAILLRFANLPCSSGVYALCESTTGG